MTETHRRFPPVLLAVPPILAAETLVSPWPVHRLVEQALLPGGVMRPYAAVAGCLAGTVPGDA